MRIQSPSRVDVPARPLRDAARSPGKPTLGVLVAGMLALSACGSSDENTETDSATSSAKDEKSKSSSSSSSSTDEKSESSSPTSSKKQQKDPDSIDFGNGATYVPGSSMKINLQEPEQSDLEGKDMVRIPFSITNTSDDDAVQPSKKLEVTASMGDPRQKAKPITMDDLGEDFEMEYVDTIKELHTLPETEKDKGIENFVIPDDVDKDNLWVRVAVRFTPVTDKLVFEGRVTGEMKGSGGPR